MIRINLSQSAYYFFTKYFSELIKKLSDSKEVISLVQVLGRELLNSTALEVNNRRAIFYLGWGVVLEVKFQIDQRLLAGVTPIESYSMVKKHITIE